MEERNRSHLLKGSCYRLITPKKEKQFKCPLTEKWRNKRRNKTKIEGKKEKQKVIIKL